MLVWRGLENRLDTIEMKNTAVKQKLDSMKSNEVIFRLRSHASLFDHKI